MEAWRRSHRQHRVPHTRGAHPEGPQEDNLRPLTSFWACRVAAVKTFSAIAVVLCACATEQAVVKPLEVAAPPKVFSAPALRSDGSTRPTKVTLDLTVVPEAKTLSGTVRLELEVTTSTEVVWLNATGLTIASAAFANGPAKIIEGNADFVGFVSPSPLAVGHTTLEVQFRGPIDHQRSLGVYAETEGSDVYAYTFFEPIDARRAFPCFDEPSAKVPWKLTLHVKKEHVALANAPLEKETDEAGGMKRVEFIESKPLPSYLVAFVVGPFEVIDGGSAGRANTPIRFVVPKGRAGELGWAKEVTPLVVTALENWFDMAYPFTKLDVAVVPRYWGTMEHPGLVAMGQPLTLIKPEQASRQRKQHYAGILAHELAHYWFGDVVTNAWWGDTWLNESLGTWMDLIITDAVAPEWKVRDTRVDVANGAMEADEMLTTQPVRLAVTTRQEIGSAFSGAITYMKGASVMRMFEASAGPERWRAFIQSYIHRHEWQNATGDEFIAEAREALGDDVGTGLFSFLTAPGVPRIESALQCAAGKNGLVLKQTRSLAAGLVEPQRTTWSVPVCFRVGDAKQSTRRCTTLASNEGYESLGFCPTWVVLNDSATGYYRSAVDLAHVTKLLTASSADAKQARLSVAERKMLLHDVVAAVARDEVKLDALLALAPLIQRDEDDRVVVEAIAITRLRTSEFDAALTERYATFRRSLCAPLAKKLGWQRAAGDSDERQTLRARALSCAGQAKDPETLKQAAALSSAWLADHSKLSDDLVSTALQVAARGADAKRFDAFLDAARKETVRTQRSRLLMPVGAFTEPTLAARAREPHLGQRIRPARVAGARSDSAL